MKWFHIKFSQTDLFTKSDEKLVSQFIKLRHNLGNPENLALCSLKFKQEDLLTYFISAPIEAAYQVKTLIAQYDAIEVSRPDLKVLNVELGTNELFDEK